MKPGPGVATHSTHYLSGHRPQVYLEVTCSSARYVKMLQSLISQQASDSSVLTAAITRTLWLRIFAPQAA